MNISQIIQIDLYPDLHNIQKKQSFTPLVRVKLLINLKAQHVVPAHNFQLVYEKLH